MTDTRTTTMGPNVRRFVRSAWLLLIAQLLATLIALGATGWAAFYVADLRAERDALRAEVAQLTAGTVEQPAYEEPLAEEIAVIEPAPVEEEAVVTGDTLPPPPSPAPRPPATTTRTPVTAAPRPTPQTDEPAPQPSEPSAPPPRNTTYPGGLPGEGPNAEPPYAVEVPGRYDGGRVRVPRVPQIDPGRIIDRPPQRDPRPPVTQPTPNDPQANRLADNRRVS
jgi:hypothetical protein